jgi:hypothetical protein
MVPIADIPATVTAATGGAEQPAESPVEAASPEAAIGAATWQAPLTFEAASPRWSGRQARRRRGATVSRAIPPHRPLSASLPAKAYEIDPGPAP